MTAARAPIACAIVLAAAIGRVPDARVAAAPVAPLDSARVADRRGAALPGDLVLRDESGHALRLGQLFGPSPALLVFSYDRCTTLCDLLGEHLVLGLGGTDLSPGHDYRVLDVSLDPRDTPASRAARRARLARVDRHGVLGAWRMLTGDPASLAALARAAGVSSAWDAAHAQLAHPAVVLTLTPAGRVSGALADLTFPPAALQSALHAAAARRTAPAFVAFVLRCFHAPPGSRSARLLALTRWTCAGFALGMAGALGAPRLRARRGSA